MPVRTINQSTPNATPEPAQTEERRRAPRTPARLAVSGRRCDLPEAITFRGVTRNVSTHGMLLETSENRLLPGSRVDLSVRIPAGQGVLSVDAHGTCSGEVVRVRRRSPATAHAGERYDVAIHLTQPLRLDV